MLTALMMSAALAGAGSPPPNLDDLIARHAAARGGADKLRAINNVVMTGKLRPDGFSGDITYAETVTRDGSVRTEVSLQGLTAVQAWDGHAGWQIQPFQGRKDPESLSADDTKSLAEEADIDTALIDYRSKGTAEFVGTEDVDGAPAYVIKVSLKNGDQKTYYLDPDALMVIRVVTRQIIRGAEQQTVTDYGDYELVNGVYFPFEVASGPKGSSSRNRIIYETITANATVNPSIFQRPATPAAPAASH